MALLTDGNPNDLLALQGYETGILDVAATETIDLDIKLGLATAEISEDVLDILLDHTRSVDPESNIRRATGVSDVVVTPPMKRWQAMHTLEIVYRDAFNNQLNDRYGLKMTEYRKLSKDAKDHTIKFGIGLALNPVPKAGAPALSTVTGATADTTYYIVVNWVSALGQQGAPCDVTAFESFAGSALVVQAVNPPSIATGFNVYLGMTATTLALQTPTPVAVGQNFTVPDAGLVAGAAPGNGQTPDVYVVGGPTLRRG
jgi:hypothetical protein